MKKCNLPNLPQSMIFLRKKPRKCSEQRLSRKNVLLKPFTHRMLTFLQTIFWEMASWMKIYLKMMVKLVQRVVLKQNPKREFQKRHQKSQRILSSEQVRPLPNIMLLQMLNQTILMKMNLYHHLWTLAVKQN